jgi:mRNA deadenylase 3'-5' endonuclease subunit Ccr4
MLMYMCACMLLVANTHLFWHPLGSSVRIRQASMMMAQVFLACICHIFMHLLSYVCTYIDNE